jgi:signal transduction histidine kinase
LLPKSVFTPKLSINGIPQTTGLESNLCKIVVEDNGIGFDEKYIDRIFTVFQRLHGRTDYEGSGVGLAVCRKITERHNGHITAQSSEGHGAKFIVTLPKNQTQGENIL